MSEGRAATPSRYLGVAAAVAFLTCAAFADVRHAGFLGFDDDKYVTANEHVLSGLTLSGLRWAFTSFDAANWHPLTWISHMLDQELFPGDAGAQHLMNLAFHALNSVLVFGVFQALLGGLWRAALIAALFGIHPLHVESVAWLSERKDVLSTTFWLLSTGAWIAWTRRGGAGRYGAALLLAALGLAAKPMVVTLPFTFLLFDFWPLRRPGLGPVRLVVEKLPFFLLSAAVAVLTLLAHREGGSVVSSDVIRPDERVVNAAVACVRYLETTFWPDAFSAYHAHPGLWGWNWICAAVLVLAGMTGLSWRLRRPRPYLLTGWLFFIGTLLPTLGLVQVGGQSMAERYTYVPLLGIFMILACAGADLRRALPALRIPLSIAATLALVVCFVQTRAYVPKWRDTYTLFSHSLTTSPDNALARTTVGRALAIEGEYAAAIPHYEVALKLDPEFGLAHYNLGDAALALRDTQRAATHFKRATELLPGRYFTHLMLGVALQAQGSYAAAVEAYRVGISLRPADPENAAARAQLALLLAWRGDDAGARAELATALQELRHGSGRMSTAQIARLAQLASEGARRIGAMDLAQAFEGLVATTETP